MLTLKDIGRIITEETRAVLEADTRIKVPRVSPHERGVRDAEKEFFGAYGKEPIEDKKWACIGQVRGDQRVGPRAVGSARSLCGQERRQERR